MKDEPILYREFYRVVGFDPDKLTIQVSQFGLDDPNAEIALCETWSYAAGEVNIAGRVLIGENEYSICDLKVQIMISLLNDMLKGC